jgi:hypothetical protein
VLLEHPWGTHWELEWNTLGTKEKWKNIDEYLKSFKME